ncbi:unnamed protein product [Orchesella dallaii]|uniref:Uncharacterized protein n=1 Tax=Orchesella dallaii TaxID=48710 RepID=A0ABP1RJF0_9HEXA
MKRRKLAIDVSTPATPLHAPPNRLLDALQATNNNSFEKLCVSLLSCQQIKPFLLLKQCVLSNNKAAAMFITPQEDLLEFLQSDKKGVILLQCHDFDLTITRIKNTIGPDITVLMNSSDTNFIAQNNSVIFCCEYVTNKVVNVQLYSKN